MVLKGYSAMKGSRHVHVASSQARPVMVIEINRSSYSETKQLKREKSIIRKRSKIILGQVRSFRLSLHLDDSQHRIPI